MEGWRDSRTVSLATWCLTEYFLSFSACMESLLQIMRVEKILTHLCKKSYCRRAPFLMSDFEVKVLRLNWPENINKANISQNKRIVKGSVFLQDLITMGWQAIGGKKRQITA